MGVHQNHIDVAWAAAGEPAPNINPSNVTDVVGEYARAAFPSCSRVYTTVKTAYVNA